MLVILKYILEEIKVLYLLYEEYKCCLCTSTVYEGQNIVEMQLYIWLIWHSGIYCRCNTATI